jgi:hypothetical protein
MRRRVEQRLLARIRQDFAFQSRLSCQRIRPPTSKQAEGSFSVQLIGRHA